ncbi:MAG: hypothetical protein IPJ23_07670 [Ignavibacteriales bacterium]|nr:hypothetical protein [Ignavibacteriales bacterium]
MSIAIIVLYVSTIAWIFPIFRQYKCNLFYFFLFLGLSDPLTILLVKIFHIHPGIISVIVAPILFYTVNIDRKKDFNIKPLEIFVVVLTAILLLTISNFDIILLIIHTLILIRVLYKILIELHHKQLVNLFHIVLAFYMTTSVASLIIYLNGDHKGIILFYINLAFQILIALFFSIFREDNPKLTYNVTPALKD